MFKNVFAGVGVILSGAVLLLMAYGWGVDDGMYPEENNGRFAETIRKNLKSVRESKN